MDSSAIPEWLMELYAEGWSVDQLPPEHWSLYYLVTSPSGVRRKTGSIDVVGRDRLPGEGLVNRQDIYNAIRATVEQIKKSETSRG